MFFDLLYHSSPFNTCAICKRYNLSFTAPYIPIAKTRGFTAQSDNVVVTVSTTVCIDAENPDDAIEKVSQALNNGDVNMSTDIASNIGYSMRNGHYEVTDAIPMDE